MFFFYLIFIILITFNLLYYILLYFTLFYYIYFSFHFLLCFILLSFFKLFYFTIFYGFYKLYSAIIIWNLSPTNIIAFGFTNSHFCGNLSFLFFSFVYFEIYKVVALSSIFSTIFNFIIYCFLFIPIPFIFTFLHIFIQI